MFGSILITGTSSGIGAALAREWLERGRRVLGLSRREPGAWAASERFRFVTHDLADHAGTGQALKQLMAPGEELAVAVLNAGVLGPFGDLVETPLEQIRDVFEVNALANKTLMDALFTHGPRPAQVVTISSGAAVNGHRGWGAYSLSKAALNMLTKLYAAEFPQTHFTALAPGLVDTAMQDVLCSLPADERYPSLAALRSRRGTVDMPEPDAVAARLADVIESLPRRVPSGSFADVRELD